MHPQFGVWENAVHQLDNEWLFGDVVEVFEKSAGRNNNCATCFRIEHRQYAM